MTTEERILALCEMYRATTTLTLGLAGLVVDILPKKEMYKIEVLLEAHNDALNGLKMDIKKGKEE